MKQILLFLTTGFEEIEALATVDILRRAALEIKMVSLTESKQVEGSHNIVVTADLLFDEIDLDAAQLLIVPGGTVRFNDHQGLKEVLVAFAKQDKPIAAICAAPMVLGGLGLLQGKRATCYPGFEHYLIGATLQTADAVVVDGDIITGRGPGLTFDFALQLVELLQGVEKRNEVARGLLI